MRLSRRSGALADEAERHGMSAFGDLGYPADFPFFKYVNPDAPKGGVYSETVSSRAITGHSSPSTRSTAYILKGEGAYGMDYTFAALMARVGRRAGCDVRICRAQRPHLR